MTVYEIFIITIKFKYVAKLGGVEWRSGLGEEEWRNPYAVHIINYCSLNV